VFIRETNAMLKKHWMLCIYAVLLLTGRQKKSSFHLSAPSSGLSTDAFPVGFNFLAHGSQDLYPTYVQENKGLSAHASVVATIIGNCVRDPYCFILLLSFFLFRLLHEYSLLSCVLSQPFLSF
jgi:SHS family lactate transporter-like MFS transporter